MRVLDDEARRGYMENLGIDRTMKSYVKHILNWHDGEVRLLGDFQWVRFDLVQFPAAGGDQVVPGGFTVFHPHLLALLAHEEPGRPRVAVPAQDQHT